jgi:putative spermidine/putrescine transport system substrate-binding protein
MDQSKIRYLSASLVVASLLTLSAGSEAQDSGRLVYADYGGTTRNVRTELLRPFAQEKGLRIISADVSPAKLVLFNEQKRSDWDAAEIDAWDIVRFKQQGLLKAFPASVQRSDLMPPEIQDVAGAGYVYAMGIAYRTDNFTGNNKPNTWAEFFDTKKFPGKRALPRYAQFQLEIALLADGVPCEKLYPLDFDRAFKKLDTIRGDILFYDSYGQMMQYLGQKSVSLALAPNSRIQIPADAGEPLGFTWNQAIQGIAGSVVPKYAPNADAGFAAINYMSDAKQQAQWTDHTKYGPLNSKAVALLDSKTAAQLPNAHLKEMCKLDNVGLAKQYDEYNDRFTQWLAKK